MESVRIRLVFEDRHILSKSQRSEGLKRCWLLLKSQQQQQTISELSSYFLHIFDLHLSCPNGLLLSMDGFVLPPFESTCILKDEDIVSVKKKGGILSDIIKAANSVKEVKIVEKQSVNTGVLLLANEEFDKETGGYESESEEDEGDQLEDTIPVENSLGGNAASKKRKASKKLQSSKKKKNRSMVPDGVKNDDHPEQVDNYHSDGVLPRKIHHKKAKVSDAKSKPNMLSAPESAENKNNFESTLIVKRSDQIEENGDELKDVSHMPEGSRKVPSRSARRKKSKRQWLRELVKAQKKDVVCHSNGLIHSKEELAKAEKKEVVSHSKGLLHWKQFPEQDLHKDMIEQEQPTQSNDKEDDVIPIVIRPGHIRFEPPGIVDADQAVEKSQLSVENYQWNGITSKKKGQNLENEIFSFAQSNDHKELNKEYCETLTIEEEMPAKDPINFDKLLPLPSLPKEGDVIAYRLIELSSSWTPELSSFRVGRISSYNSESSRIMLMTVPEYPVAEKLDVDATAMQPDNSLYREDGSLEIDFSSLVDVRVVKHSSSDLAKTVGGRVNESSRNNKDPTSSFPSNNDKQTLAPTPENGEVNPWDQISQSLNAKKAQLSEENDSSKGSSGRSSRSYRVLRGSALGPTMAYLRSKNEI